MKRKLMLILAGIMMFGSVSHAASVGIIPVNAGVSDEVELFINEEKIMFSDYAAKPYEKDGVKMLPLRAVSENLGFDVVWNGIDKSIGISKDNVYIKVFIGKDEYILDETSATSLGIPPEIAESRIFVPHTFFEKILKTDVSIDNNKISLDGYVDYVFDLEEDTDFTDIVADVPTDYMEEDFYEYNFKITPSPVAKMGSAIRIDGSNHSDDMFMAFYKKIGGFKPNETYIYKLSFDIGTNVPKGMSGIGGSPGSSVWVKAGIVPAVPLMEVDNINHYRITNLDKSNQNQSGADLKVVSNMEKESDDYSEDFEYKTIVKYFIATTNENGEVYVVIGTDSGFEGLTTVYYDNIKLSVKEATEYNKSIVQDVD
ncbi:MAG: copper amine oxidase N-terminal domain-containing protein [Proteocatella sp.]